MGKVQQRTLRYYAGRVDLPCEVSYAWSSENSGAAGRAEVVFNLFEMRVRGKSYIPADEYLVVMALNLTASTRDRSKKWLRGETSRQGLIIVNQLKGSRKIVLDEL